MNDAGMYSEWDVDNDGDTWDADSAGYLDSDEFYDGYDEDESGHRDATEWDDAWDGGLFDV
jgi:hypothetical protein